MSENSKKCDTVFAYTLCVTKPIQILPICKINLHHVFTDTSSIVLQIEYFVRDAFHETENNHFTKPSVHGLLIDG